jgi:hypothetical protein
MSNVDTSKRRLAALSATAGALLTAVAISAGAVAAPADDAPQNTSPPTISGTVRERETLTANTGTWSGDQPITYAFQWVRCNAQLANCAPISGATSNQYTLTQQDVGQRVLVNVTATNTAGSASAQASTEVVRARGATPRNTSRPTISGTVREGETLTANPGSWRGDQPITFAFQWFRCNAQLGDCASIPGATSNRYSLTQQHVGLRVLVNVTATNSAGSGSAQASTEVVQARAIGPQNNAPPAISGTPTEGQALTAANGTWTGTQPITFGYQWLRCDRNGGGCANIGGATGRTYRLTSADVDKTVRVRVTARNTAGSSDATSTPSAVVQPSTPPGPAGQIRLPNGKTSIPVSSVSLPHRLVIDGIQFSPNPVRSRRRAITGRVHVSDTRGFVVRGALIFFRSTPLLTTAPGEQATATDGWVALRMFPRQAFPLRRGFNVQFFARARKPGGSLLAGVSTRRLVQVRTASPR